MFCVMLNISFYIDDENTALLNIPNPLIPVNEEWVDFWEFGKPWWPSDLSNPWINGTNFAPFDQGVSGNIYSAVEMNRMLFFTFCLTN
jgi:hypothetical protein